MAKPWDEREAGQYADELQRGAYLARLLGRDRSLILAGGSLSVKGTGRDVFGEEQALLFFAPVGQPLPGAEGGPPAETAPFIAVRRKDLARLAGLEGLTGRELAAELLRRRVDPRSPPPPPEVLLHALLPDRYVCLTAPEALMAIASTLDGLRLLQELYGPALLAIPYVPPGPPLARALAEALQAVGDRSLAGILLSGHGLLTSAGEARAVYEDTLRVAALAEGFLSARGAWELGLPEAVAPARPLRTALATLRKSLAELAGCPILLGKTSDPAGWALAQRVAQGEPGLPGPVLAGQASQAGTSPPAGRADETGAPADQDQAVDGEHRWPRVLFDPELGLLTTGRTAREMDLAAARYGLSARTTLRAIALGGYQPFSPDDIRAVGSAAAGPPGPFTGEVALVTGGASGIGKACVEALLRRGAAVVTMDINPNVNGLYDRPDFLGICCDLTDEGAVSAAFETLARRFGGLDMLVLNAGIFPAGCRIEALSLVEWQRVMRINLDSNLVVMRESYPLLKRAPNRGRVLVNASKNVLAPGAGAAAYSASKAAVTQMARVAALEWGKDGIRVNMIHPDAIFDTGIWTEEVLQARAAHYGLTIQQYKTRNVLGVELNSRFVGELAAEMLGPLFEKITGAQIPVDGGSDRVI